jgi:hypothetical protein
VESASTCRNARGAKGSPAAGKEEGGACDKRGHEQEQRYRGSAAPIGPGPGRRNQERTNDDAEPKHRANESVLGPTQK